MIHCLFCGAAFDVQKATPVLLSVGAVMMKLQSGILISLHFTQRNYRKVK